jgi:hypothetical protein
MAGHEKDRAILRELASKAAEIAALPVQEEKRRLWRKLNGLKPERPMVTIDQVCWGEMDIDGKLVLRCEDRECRAYETFFRRILFQWEYFPVDMVVEPFIKVHKAVHNSGFGITTQEHTLAAYENSDVLSHKFENQFNSVDDVMNKVKQPVITHDAAETKRRMEFASWLFDGVMPLREEGFDPYLSIWDPIATWMSVEGALYGLVDKPDMMHALAKRIVDGYMSELDQLEEQGLLCHSQSLVHCTGAAPPEYKDLVDTVYLANMFCELEAGNITIDQLDPAILDNFGISSSKQIENLLERFSQGFKQENQR